MIEQKTKYEIRSNEVQEVMSRPPHFIVNWGNMLIVIAIVIAVAFMNEIHLKKKETLLATFISKQSHRDTHQILFSLNISPVQVLPPGSPAIMNVLGNNAVSVGTLDATVDSLWKDGSHTFLTLNVVENERGLLRMRNNRLLNPSQGMQVSLNIITGKEKILQTMLRKLLRK